MARLKLAFPEPAHFSTVCPVRIGDINYGGHLGNDAVLSLIHEARIRYFSHLGMSELDAGGAGIIMTDSAISYLMEVFHGTELEIEIAAGDVAGMYFELYYRMKNADAVTHVAKTGFVCFDYEKRRVVPVPQALAEALRGNVGGAERQ